MTTSAQKQRPGAKPELVIRPSGVWDTRAPLFQFIKHHRRENQIYHSLVLGVSKLVSEADSQDQALPAVQFFDYEKSGYTAIRTWGRYEESFPKDARGRRPQPTIKDACDSLRSCIPAFTEYAIVSYCGIFETYVQCWALNYLLAKLESGAGWIEKEENIARAFYPFTKGNVPGFRQICKAFPIIEETLKKVPRVSKDPNTRKEVKELISPNLNAFQAISFWIEWRNLLVHTSGMVNQEFMRKHSEFWEDFKRGYPHIRDIEGGKRLSLNNETFAAMTTPFYRAAKSLRDVLVNASRISDLSVKRGHSNAPGPVLEGVYVRPEKAPPPMLMKGDHELSHSWASDAEFRRRMRPLLAED